MKNVIFSIFIATTLFGSKSDKSNEDGNQKGNSNLTPIKL